MVNLTGLISASVISNAVEKFIQILFESIGNYGVTVIVFTLILKAALSPLDVWQKTVMLRNNRAMERMKPQLEKLQKQYGSNKELYSQKQMELYRKEKYSMVGACLPTLLTLVIFFMVFAGFNQMVVTRNATMYTDMETAYNTAYAESVGTEAEKTALAEQAVLEKYEADYEKQNSFLWVRNVFMPDSWKKPIPDYNTFTGSGIGKLRVQMEIEDGTTGYNKIMSPLMEKYNSRWNGFLILPILSILVSFAAQKLMKQVQPPAPPSADPGNQDMQNAMQTNMKMMQYFMPIMMGVFAVLYSTAFTIYMVVSNIFSSLFQLIFNIVSKAHDKKAEEKRLATTYK